MTSHALLERLFAAAVEAVDPAPTTARALRRLALPPTPSGRVHLFALGKAAHAMARAAVAALAERGAVPAGGIVVAHEPADAPHLAVPVIVGDHPIPGAASRAAADALGRAAAAVGPDDVAVVLLSGGTSSLVGAPIDGVGASDLAALTRTLLGAGADIGFVNAVRRRVARWGAGRLAVALAPARIACLVMSDVPGHPASLVGSGPCAPEALTAAAVVALLREARVWDAVPASVRGRLHDAAHGGPPDVPLPTHAAFARVTVEPLADNATACAAAAVAARRAGLEVVVHDGAVAGEASALGAAFARTLRASAPGTVHVWGGEAAVTLAGAPPNALGGRMQELALAAAIALRGERGLALLAAGTDGRDGPTDAAGAAIDGATFDRAVAAGRDPAADLAAHRSHAALDAAGALLRTGPTGTNVADLVIGVVEAADRRAR